MFIRQTMVKTYTIKKSKEKIKMKKTIILFGLASSLALSSPYTGYAEDNAPSKIYENGFFHGINCIEREFEMQLKGGKDIVFEGKYLVVMPTKSLPKEQILIYKNYGYLEGMMPVTIEDGYIVFKALDREADAKYLVDEILNAKYFKGDDRATIINNAKPTYRKSDFIYGKILDNVKIAVEKSLQTQVYVVDLNEDIKTPISLPKTEKALKPIVKKKVNKQEVKKVIIQTEKPKKYPMLQTNGKVQTYKYTGKGKKLDASKIIEYIVTQADKKYPIAGVYKATDGSSYYKVQGENIYIEVDDATKIN